MNEQALAIARGAVVRDHMESENHHAFDQTLATFAHPRYELMATGEVFDGCVSSAWPRIRGRRAAGSRRR